jgi:hypothetical protein
MDRTHRRFFTRSSLLRLLGEAGLCAQVWDQVSAPWSPERVKEELQQIGVPPSDELVRLLTGPDSSAYQYVVMARPATEAEKKTRLVLICPEEMPGAETLRGWREAAGDSRELVAVMRSDALDRFGTMSPDTLAARIITFGDAVSIGAALNSALPSSSVGAVIFAHVGVRPERALMEALERAVEGGEARDLGGAFAEAEPGPGAGRKWWIEQARPPQRVKDLSLEFCRGLNLAVSASRFSGERFAEDLSFPWVMAEWLGRAKEREFKFVKVKEARARLDFSPDPSAMAAAYRSMGEGLAALPAARSYFVERRLPAPLSPGKRIKQALRGVMARVSSGKGEKYFERLRASSLRQGYERGRAEKK